jgi:pimeloyl-ACP methyl ester carboxylesterase
MGMAFKIGLVLASVAVIVLIAFFFLLFLRPVAVTVWRRRNALRRAGLRKMKIPTAAGKQAVWQGGAGPLLVLLHGAGDQAGTWSKVAPELKRHLQLLIPDLAGHGESEPREGALSLGTLLAALEQVLDALPQTVAPMVIAGNSLGAWMAMLYAQKCPHRVSRVILIDGGPIKNPSEFGLMPKDRAEARRTLDAVYDPSSPRPPNFVLDDLVRLANSGPISRLLAAGMEDISKYLLEDKLEAFPLPVDLIWGGSDRLVPLEYAKRLQSQLPYCTLSVIERCGHGPQLECPRGFTRVLLRILASEPARAPVNQPASSGQSEDNS